MRFMVIVKATKEYEDGAMPDEKLLTDMSRFNEELANAGVMLAGEGLLPSSRGARVAIRGGKATVIDGPFAEAKELVGGFWIWKVASKAEAVEWAKRVPCVDMDLELRQVSEPADFGDDFTPEARAREARAFSKARLDNQ